MTACKFSKLILKDLFSLYAHLYQIVALFHNSDVNISLKSTIKTFITTCRPNSETLNISLLELENDRLHIVIIINCHSNRATSVLIMHASWDQTHISSHCVQTYPSTMTFTCCF
jgi:hypothetical protein